MSEESDRGESFELPEAAPASSALRSFFGLFLVPLMVVLVCVGIFVGFGWIAHDKATTRDYLNDLRSGRRARRSQAAYELSKVLVADPQALDRDPGAKAELRSMFVDADHEETKRYLALVLGYLGDPEAIPLLTAELDSSDSETRIYVLWALGAIGDPRAAPPLILSLADEDPGIRKTAAFALGELGEPGTVAALLPLLADSTADVRWNSALALARLGSDKAAPVLLRMLDRDLTSEVPGITSEQQQETMVSAISGLTSLQYRAALPTFEELAEGDPSMKVRQAAIEGGKVLSMPD